MSRLDKGLENGISSGSENRLREIKKQHMHALADYRQKLYREPKLKELFLELTLNCNAAAAGAETFEAMNCRSSSIENSSSR